MFTLIALLLLVGLASFLLYVSGRPSDFRYERRTTIAARAENVFALIDDFAAWRGWSPWEGIDPDLDRSYSGPARGVGCAYAWKGNKKVGRGSMEITQSVSPSKLTLRLDFFEPFEAHNTAEFVLSSVGSGTEVIWTMTGRYNFFSKLMGTIFDMEAFVGKDFEKGLAQLKTLAEN